MDKELFVNTLRDSLAKHGFPFDPTQVHSHKWNLKSQSCEIHVPFERYEDDFNIELNEPDGKREPMSLLLLRFLAGANGSEIQHKDDSPEFIADLLSFYFSELLKGDFSIRSRYDAVKDVFFVLLFDAQRLADDSAIKRKIATFDLSWLELMQRSSE